MKKIKWKTVSVAVSKIKPTPGNFKIKTDEGTFRFNTSVEKYGLAGAVILNTDFTLIDGNTRWDKAKQLGEKFIDASMPDRKLTPKEFTEFAAMYDLARAGEVDLMRIKNELGTSEKFFKDWGMAMPQRALEQLKELEANENVISPSTPKNGKNGVTAKEFEMSRLTLSFSPDEAAEYIRLAESLYVKFKVDNITDLSLKALRFLAKNK